MDLFTYLNLADLHAPTMKGRRLVAVLQGVAHTLGIELRDISCDTLTEMLTEDADGRFSFPPSGYGYYVAADGDRAVVIAFLQGDQTGRIMLGALADCLVTPGLPHTMNGDTPWRRPFFPGTADLDCFVVETT